MTAQESWIARSESKQSYKDAKVEADHHVTVDLIRVTSLVKRDAIVKEAGVLHLSIGGEPDEVKSTRVVTQNRQDSNDFSN